jgi:hypothetical protein
LALRLSDGNQDIPFSRITHDPNTVAAIHVKLIVRYDVKSFPQRRLVKWTRFARRSIDLMFPWPSDYLKIKSKVAGIRRRTSEQPEPAIQSGRYYRGSSDRKRQAAERVEVRSPLGGHWPEDSRFVTLTARAHCLEVELGKR